MLFARYTVSRLVVKSSKFKSKSESLTIESKSKSLASKSKSTSLTTESKSKSKSLASKSESLTTESKCKSKSAKNRTRVQVQDSSPTTVHGTDISCGCNIT